MKCIHPVLLSRVVEPLHVIPESRMLAAFRYQALNAGDMNVMKWKLEFVTRDVVVRENGTMVRCGSNHIPKTRIVHGSMLINHGQCEWDISIEGRCSNCFIGLAVLKHSRFSSNPVKWMRWVASTGDLHYGRVDQEERTTATFRSIQTMSSSSICRYDTSYMCIYCQWQKLWNRMV